VRAFIRRRRTQGEKTSDFRISYLVVVVFLLGVVAWQPVGAVAEGAQALERGVKAFRAGDYRAALQSFLDARQAGLDIPGLRYNLGVTYYRLQRYSEAEHEFRGLASDSEWAPLAHYNLGLTAQRMGRQRQAIEHFEQAHRITTDPNLGELAATALERLGAAPPPRTNAVVSLAGGHDSNVALSPDAATTEISHRSDFFAETLAAASHRLAGDTARSSYAYGGLVLRKYRDLHQFDVTGLRAGLGYDTDSVRLQTDVRGYFDAVYIGGHRFGQTAAVDVRARRRLDAGGDLRGRYQLGYIAGGAGFGYLDGWEQRFTADAGFALASALLRLGYQLELNNRRDLQQEAEFFSSSPTRHSLFATAALRNVSGWQAAAHGEYRVSRYNDPNRLNGGTLEVRRKDDRYGFALRANRRLAAPWRAFVDYSYYRNDSNLNSYDYSRYQLMVGIEGVLER
jgi:tetratricopeptide (TPR) repeat protein